MQTSYSDASALKNGLPRKPWFLQLTEGVECCRPARIPIPAARCESSETRRALLAAKRDAELQKWMDSGGDYLDHNYRHMDCD